MFGADALQTPFAMVMECLARVLKGKIITSENDMFGLVFVGSVRARVCGFVNVAFRGHCGEHGSLPLSVAPQNKTKNINNFTNIFFASDLDNPSAAIIKQLEVLRVGVGSLDRVAMA